MVQLRFCLLLAALCACIGLGSSITTPPTKIINIPSADASKPAAEGPALQTTKSAEAKETTPAPTNPPAPATPPITTPPTTPPPTTTPPTTTPPTTTPPTTTPPTTTPPTTTPPSTTPAPTPAPGPMPPPQQGKWEFTNSTNNVTCIVIQFAAQLDVKYPKATSLANVTINVPSNATVVGGSCDDTEQLITLSWPAGTSNISNTMTLAYYRNDTTKSYGLKSLDIALSPDLFVNASSKTVVELKHGADWQTPLATSYRCVPPTRLSMEGDAASGAAAYLTFSQLQEEAFRNVNGTGFSSPRDCGGGDVPDAVPIAVGCALGGLVLVVLIAYLVGRRRSAARGYLSM